MWFISCYLFLLLLATVVCSQFSFLIKAKKESLWLMTYAIVTVVGPTCRMLRRALNFTTSHTKIRKPPLQYCYCSKVVYIYYMKKKLNDWSPKQRRCLLYVTHIYCTFCYSERHTEHTHSNTQILYIIYNLFIVFV